MTFTAEINIKKEDGLDMTLDCASPGIPLLKADLVQTGFSISRERIAIQGTNNISDLIELTIDGSDFSNLRESMIKFLDARNLNYTEEQFNSSGDLHSRFNLEDISIFDKAS